MNTEELFRRCKDMFKGTNIKVVTPIQAPRLHGHVYDFSRPVPKVVFVDYVSKMPLSR